MLNKAKNDISRWSKKKTKVLISILVLFTIGSMNVPLQGLIFLGILIFIIRARNTGKKEQKEYISKLRDYWNNYFKDNSFDDYFVDLIQEVEYFERIYRLEFELRRLRQAQKQNANQDKQENKEEYKKYEKDSSTTNRNDELENALIYFKFKSLGEVSKDTLKKVYKSKIIEVHPDIGGSIDETQILNKYYNLLKQYA